MIPVSSSSGISNELASKLPVFYLHIISYGRKNGSTKVKFKQIKIEHIKRFLFKSFRKVNWSPSWLSILCSNQIQKVKENNLIMPNEKTFPFSHDHWLNQSGTDQPRLHLFVISIPRSIANFVIILKAYGTSAETESAATHQPVSVAVAFIRFKREFKRI